MKIINFYWLYRGPCVFQIKDHLQHSVIPNTMYTSKVNIESMCCKLMGFLFQSVTSCYLNFSIWPAKKVNCKNHFFIVFSTPILMATTYSRFSEREVNLITGEVSAMQDLYFDFSTYLKQYYFFIWFLYFIIWFSLVFVYQINQSFKLLNQFVGLNHFCY